MFLALLKQHKLDKVEEHELLKTLSNWSYLSLYLQEKGDFLTLAELEKLMLVEWENKRRYTILKRLFTRWQKIYQQEAFGELGV